ncbi:MAG: amino acid ABC transporter substrate-binding protein [Planctomycetes bacterium]|nr:amino acid ABC transporter substrate-binding protein [Planctomycetota bacterium]
MAGLKTVVKDCLTDSSGESFSNGEVLFAVAVVAFIGLSVYATYKGVAFAPKDFGEGLAFVFGGKGAHSWGQSKEDAQ